MRFVESGTPRWERLIELLDAAARDGLRSFSAQQLDELTRLYRRATSDLAQARMRAASSLAFRSLTAHFRAFMRIVTRIPRTWQRTRWSSTTSSGCGNEARWSKTRILKVYRNCGLEPGGLIVERVR